jgi:hypothetical protein
MSQPEAALYIQEPVLATTVAVQTTAKGGWLNAAQADTAVPALAPLVLIPQCCGKGGLSRRTLYSPFRLR